MLAPLYDGENALEPERVSEKLHQNSFWMGRGVRSPMPSAASISRSGTVDGITEKPFALDSEGHLEIPDLPGLGIALGRDKLARYTPDPAPLFG